MQQVSLSSTTLQKILLSLTNQIFADSNVVDKLNKGCISRECKLISDLKGYDHQYLHEAIKHPVESFAFPNCSYGQDSTFFDPKGNLYFHELIKNVNRRLLSFVGSPQNALFMYYPPNGYIGWHHNGNAPGYNILLTYSTDGNGYFESYNPTTKQYNKLNDVKGWNLRFGYYCDQKKEPDNLFWHAAYTECPRLTIAYIFKHKPMWESLIEECTDSPVTEYLKQMGPKSA